MRALAAALLLAAAPGLAFGQQTPSPPTPPPAPPVLVTRPVSGFVVDLRGVLGKFGQRPATATALGVNASQLPGPGLGGAIGAHVYPLRIGPATLGIGGEIMLTRRSRQPTDTAGEPLGPNLRSRAFSMAPQVSLNFGRRNGWSFVSAGLGTASFETWADGGDVLLDGAQGRPDRRVRAINYGGGARWFSSPHLAFTVDLRFYAISPGPADGNLAERARTRLLMISAGVSVR